MSDKPNLVDVRTLTAFAVDFSLDPIGGGGIPVEGRYVPTVKELGLLHKDGKVTLAVTLSGVGDRDTYDYVTLPTNPAAEHYKTYQRALIGFLQACNPQFATLKSAAGIDGNVLAGLIGSKPPVYYIPPETGADGKILTGSRQEVTYLTPDTDARLVEGNYKPVRRMKTAHTASPQSLGAVVAPVAAVAAPVTIAAPAIAAPALVAAPAPVTIAAPVAVGGPAVPVSLAALGIAAP